MAQQVVFDGRVIVHPGGATRTDVSALAQLVLGPKGIIGILGESDVGQSGVLHRFDEPSSAEGEVGDDLLDAIHMAFNPGNDPGRVDGGATRVYAYVTNTNAQGEFALLNETGVHAGGFFDAGSTTTVLVDAAGAFGAAQELANFWVIITAGAAAGQRRQIVSHTGTALTVSPALTVAPDITSAYDVRAPVINLTSAAYGLPGNRVEVTTNVGSAPGRHTASVRNGTEVRASGDLGGELDPAFQIRYDPFSALAAVAGLAGAAASDDGLTFTAVAGCTTSLVKMGDTTGITANMVVRVLSGLAAGEVCPIDANVNATDISVRPDFDTAMTAGDTFRIEQLATSVGAAVPQFQDDGTTHMIVQARGAVAPTSTAVTVNLYDGGATDTIALLQIAANSWVQCIEGTMVGQIRRAAIPHLVNQILVSAPWGPSGQPTAPAAGDLFIVWDDTHDVTLRVTGAEGAATTVTVLKNAVTQTSATITPTTTIQNLTDALNVMDGLVATAGPRRAASTLASTFDFGRAAADDNYDENILAGSVEPYTIRDNIAQMVAWFNTNASDLLTAVRATDDVLAANEDRIGSQAPDNMAGAYGTLFGGSSAESSATSFQAGFDLMLQQRINTVVPLISSDITITGGTIDWDVIAAQLRSHLSDGTAQNTERNGYLGVDAALYEATALASGGSTNSLEARIRSYNDRNLSVVGQKVTTYKKSTNTYEEVAEWMTAVCAAGMQAGVPVGEPITFKIPNVASFSNNADWNPDDFTDSNYALRAGLLFLEHRDDGIIRWVRGLTTYIASDNLALNEISVNEVRNYVSYELREDLVDAFVGRRTGRQEGAQVSIPASAASIKGRADAWLEAARADGIIVDSEDPDTGEVLKAYQNLRVSISGDIARVRYQFFPVTGLNYILIDQYLQLPVATA